MASGDVVVTAAGDEDTANMYITVSIGSSPSDPTSSVYDATIAGQSGTVNTGVNCPVGSTAYVKVRGYNSTPTAGPVFGPITSTYQGAGSATVYRITDVTLTWNVSSGHCLPKITYSADLPPSGTLDIDGTTQDSDDVINTGVWAITGETTASRTDYTGYGGISYDYNKPTNTGTVIFTVKVTLRDSLGVVVDTRSASVTYNYVIAL